MGALIRVKYIGPQCFQSRAGYEVSIVRIWEKIDTGYNGTAL